MADYGKGGNGGYACMKAAKLQYAKATRPKNPITIPRAAPSGRPLFSGLEQRALVRFGALGLRALR